MLRFTVTVLNTKVHALVGSTFLSRSRLLRSMFLDPAQRSSRALALVVLLSKRAAARSFTSQILRLRA